MRFEILIIERKQLYCISTANFAATLAAVNRRSNRTECGINASIFIHNRYLLSLLLLYVTLHSLLTNNTFLLVSKLCIFHVIPTII
jgi:hypothetical protein